MLNCLRHSRELSGPPASGECELPQTESGFSFHQDDAMRLDGVLAAWAAHGH